MIRSEMLNAREDKEKGEPLIKSSRPDGMVA